MLSKPVLEKENVVSKAEMSKAALETGNGFPGQTGKNSDRDLSMANKANANPGEPLSENNPVVVRFNSKQDLPNPGDQSNRDGESGFKKTLAGQNIETETAEKETSADRNTKEYVRLELNALGARESASGGSAPENGRQRSSRCRRERDTSQYAFPGEYGAAKK